MQNFWNTGAHMSQNQRVCVCVCVCVCVYVCVWIRKYFIKTPFYIRSLRQVWCANDAEHLGCGDVEEGEAS